MALIIDGVLNTPETLRQHDSLIADVATSEGIDLAGKLSLAWQEVQDEIRAFLQEEGGWSIEQALVSERILRWHAFRTLECVYRDAFFSQHNDRYGERWRHYRERAVEVRRDCLRTGVPVILAPLRRPTQVETRIEDGPLTANTYWIRASYVNSSGQESAPTPVKAISAPVPHQIVVRPLFPPANAAGWRVYVGLSEDNTGLQNPIPLGLEQAWVSPPSGVVEGRNPENGQPADLYVRRSWRTKRG